MNCGLKIKSTIFSTLFFITFWYMVQLNIFISSLQLLSVHKNGQMPCNAVLKDIHFNICTSLVFLLTYVNSSLTMRIIEFILYFCSLCCSYNHSVGIIFFYYYYYLINFSILKFVYQVISTTFYNDHVYREKYRLTNLVPLLLLYYKNQFSAFMFFA